MNYLRAYCNLIRKAENRDCPKGYVEKHHFYGKKHSEESKKKMKDAWDKRKLINKEKR